MAHIHNREEHINHLEGLAHKLLLVGRMLRLGSDNMDDMYSSDDIQYLREIEHKDPKQVKEELLKEMWSSSHSSHNYNYSASRV